MPSPISRWNPGGLLIIFIYLLCAAQAGAYSVLTHEELIDLAWNGSIRPFLLKKFPQASEAELREAHAYAYGGSAIQDMGYYPFGKAQFSDLTHYVRSGDFVVWMFEHAKTLDEYAFAIGALSHYLGDSIGHSQAINPATGLAFPNLARKYGPVVTYDQSPHGHVRTEFAFDVQELANSEFAPPSYLKFIGLKAPRKFLERAFVATYGFDLHDVLGRARPSLRSYRTSVRTFIPNFAEAEVVLHGHQFPAPPEDEAYRLFTKRVAQTNYERKWKHPYTGPGFKAHLLAIVVFLVPKIGPVSNLAIKIPTEQTQQWYFDSVNHTLDLFRKTLDEFGRDIDPALVLANIDLDTGFRAKLGDYPRADAAYRKLLERLTSKPQRVIPKDLQRHILDFYAGLRIPRDPEGKLAQRLDVLREMKTE